MKKMYTTLFIVYNNKINVTTKIKLYNIWNKNKKYLNLKVVCAISKLHCKLKFDKKCFYRNVVSRHLFTALNKVC